MAIEGFASRFRQWSEPGSDRKYSSRFGEYAKNAVLMWVRFPRATVAIEQSFVSARTRSTIVRIRRSEMRSRVRLTVVCFTRPIYRSGSDSINGLDVLGSGCRGPWGPRTRHVP